MKRERDEKRGKVRGRASRGEIKKKRGREGERWRRRSR